ncbi:hypothetical protein AwErysi_09520 [Erysipelotrichaceae bacterium]|nr:hypothetical protein AwErysi_09520 [Erysipelotrichaceae bacterium]
MNLKRGFLVFFVIMLMSPHLSLNANSSDRITNEGVDTTTNLTEGTKEHDTRIEPTLMLGQAETTAEQQTSEEPTTAEISKWQPLQTELAPFLNNNEQIVYTQAELKAALAIDNGITTIFFGADIQQLSGGIIVHVNKANIIIDGTNPITGERFTFRDVKSSNQGDTIRITQQPIQLTTIEMRNINLVGDNYYGPIMIVDAAKNITLRHKNIVYNGTQLAFNRYGTLEIEDAAISIGPGYQSQAQEIGEVKEVILRGTNTVSHYPRDGGFALFLETNPNLKVSLINSKTDVITSGMVFRDNGQAAHLFLSEGSEFKIVQDGNHGRAPIRLYKDASITMIDSRLEISRKLETGSSTPLLDGDVDAATSKLTATNSTIALYGNQPTSRALSTVKFIDLTNSRLDITQNKNTSDFILRTNKSVKLANSSQVNLLLVGDSTNTAQAGFYQRGPFTMEDSEFKMEVLGSIRNQILDLDSTDFRNSSMNMLTSGNINNIAPDKFILDTNSMRLDNTKIAVRQTQNAGNAVDATSFTMSNGSEVLIEANAFQGTSLLNLGSPLSIGSGGKIRVFSKTTTNPTANHLKVNGDVVVEDGGLLQVFSEGGAQTNLIQLIGLNRTFSANNPLSVILGGDAITSKLVFGINPIAFTVDAQQATMHTNSGAFTQHNALTQIPIYDFHKDGYTINTVFDGTIAANAGATSIINTNYEATDTLNPDGIFTFSTNTTKLVAYGYLDGLMNEFFVGAQIISGVSPPGSRVELTYYNGGNQYKVNPLVDSSGDFAISTLPLDNTPVAMYIAHNYLNYQTSQAPSIIPVLRFEHTPSLLDFGTQTIRNNTIINRNTGFMVEILDTRAANSNWQLGVRVQVALHSSKNTIDNAFIFKTKAGTTIQLDSIEKNVHTNIQGSMLTAIDYDATEGLLLAIDSGNIYSNEAYNGTIEWVLSDTP